VIRYYSLFFGSLNNTVSTHTQQRDYHAPRSAEPHELSWTMQDGPSEDINLQVTTKRKRNVMEEVYHVTMKVFSFISCLRTAATLNAMNPDHGNQSLNPQIPENR
jgi:hypothetical protein